MATRNINSELSTDMIQLIFSKFPFLNLPNCRLVCRSWNILVVTCNFDSPMLFPSNSNLFFALICPYRKLKFLDFDPKHLKGTSRVASFRFRRMPFPTWNNNIYLINPCNGLVSFFIKKGTIRRPRPEEVCILNPMTNEYYELPLSSEKVTSWAPTHYLYGLGFSPKTKKFKMARIFFVAEKGSTFVEIFGFGTRHGWSPVGFLSCFKIEKQCGVYFNGGLYWLGVQLQRLPNQPRVVLRLDIENEKLEQISFASEGLDYDTVFLGVFDVTLYLTLCGKIDLKYHVLRMEEDFSWTEVCVVARQIAHSPSYRLQPIKVCEDGKILCLLSELKVVLYDPETKMVEILTDQDVHIDSVYQLDSFNFNSLHDILEGKC